MRVAPSAQTRRSALMRFGDGRLKRRALAIARLGDSPVSARFCERLANCGGLSERELAELLDIRSRSITYDAGRIIADDYEPLPATIILSGWASAQRILEDGRRQVFDLLAPGDSIGLWHASHKRFAISLVALTAIVGADASGLRKPGVARMPGLVDALADAEEKAERRLYDHIVRLGRRSGRERLADLLLELYLRLDEARCVNGLRFPFPLTQEVLADFLGLTSIHVNRTLRQMREGGLARITSGWLEIENLDLLRAAASEANSHPKRPPKRG